MCHQTGHPYAPAAGRSAPREWGLGSYMNRTWGTVYRRRWVRAMVAVASAALVLAGAVPASADDISNNLDVSVDASLESASVNVGSSTSVQLKVVPLGDDGKSGCNLTGSTTLVVTTSSSASSIASVGPTEVTFDSCGATPSLTVTGVATGTA